MFYWLLYVTVIFSGTVTHKEYIFRDQNSCAVKVVQLETENRKIEVAKRPQLLYNCSRGLRT